MAFYLKGIGDAVTRQNEILPSLDARINKFLVGHTAGIIRGEYNEFSAQIVDRGVIISGGFLCAHGFFALADTETQFNFVMPQTTQYCHIYGEISLAVIPNAFEIKATAMSNSGSWTPRQDNLLVAQSGKYQLPLYQITLTNTSVSLADKRVFADKPLAAVNAENYIESGGAASNIAAKIADFQGRLAALEGGVELLAPLITTPTAWTKFGANTTITTSEAVPPGTEILAHAEIRTFNDGTVVTLIGKIALGSGSLSAAELTRPMLNSAMNSKPIGVIAVGFTTSAANKITVYAGAQGLVNLGGWATNADFSSETSGMYRVTKLYRVV